MFAMRSSYILVSVIAGAMLFGASTAWAETPQEHVRRMSGHVMPFDMAKTVHVFEMTRSGGVQRILARDPSAMKQIELIRKHLKQEAVRFERGDFSDPTKLHGRDMPGLAELRENPSRVDVSYSELPAGAQLTFETKHDGMLTAIHRWFGAQLSEHGADARAE